MGQLVQMIVQLPVEHRLQCYSGALVQELAALDQQRIVGNLLRQRVLENVFNVARSRLLVDELPRLQPREPALRVFQAERKRIPKTKDSLAERAGFELAGDFLSRQ
jgi:hypothetical protein